MSHLRWTRGAVVAAPILLFLLGAGDGTAAENACLSLIRPVVGGRVSSAYGWRIHPILGGRRFHKGVDFALPRGTPVQAAAAGMVVALGWGRGYGRYVRLRHRDGIETLYAHLDSIARGLRVGRRVAKGQRLGRVGRSGLATGPHLYWEVRVRHHPANPLPFLAHHGPACHLVAINAD